MEAGTVATRTDRAPAWLLGLIPLVLIAVALGLFAVLDGPGLGDRNGPPVEELAVERTVLEPGAIELTVRNDGPDAVSIAQAQVNDAYVQFSGADEPIGRLASAKVRVEQPWVEGDERRERHGDQQQRHEAEHPGRDPAGALDGLGARLHQSLTSKKPCQPSSVNSDWCAWNMNLPAVGKRHSRIPRWPWQSITVSVNSDGSFDVPVGK